MRLRTTIELALPGYLASVGRLWAGAGADLYPEYLVMLHTVMRASVPLMEDALTESRLRVGDPVAARLVPYLAAHIREEHGHDKWLREDLAAIGADADEPLRRPPGPSAAALVGAQYYWLRHYHPCALLGYIAVLEGYPPSVEWVESLRERTGYPGAGFRTLVRHAALDPGHRDDLYRLLDELPLTAAQQSAIGISALHTVRALTALIGDLARR